MARAIGVALCIAACALAGCKVVDKSEDDGSAEAEKRPEEIRTNSPDLIECALQGAQWFLRECQVEKVRQGDGTLILVVRHPDGGFRRFEVLTDGRGLATADGAVEAWTEVIDGRLDVEVGSDRYRFPATVRSND